MPSVPLPSFEVIQSADTYLESALLIESAAKANTDLFRPACVLAALAIEIYLKSFTAKDASVPVMKVDGLTIFAGGLKTAYGHPLEQIFSKASPAHQASILAESKRLQPAMDFESHLKKYSEFFVNGRYGHEHSSIGVLRGELIDLAEHVRDICHALLPKVYQPGD